MAYSKQIIRVVPSAKSFFLHLVLPIICELFENATSIVILCHNLLDLNLVCAHSWR